MRYQCAHCPGEIRVGDDLITVNVNGHAKAAHRVCPDAATAPAVSADNTSAETAPTRGAH